MKIDSTSEMNKFKENIHLYVDFGVRVKSLITSLLTDAGNIFLAIEMRVKDEDELKRKVERLNITHTEVQDLVGVRIITYVESDILNITKTLKEAFIVDALPVDIRLGTNKIGYRSDHWKISLTKERLELPEYKKFQNLKCELQIRTVLEHAWAQNSHNQFYKTGAQLPEKIERDFTLLAGLLEIADNEFNRIASEIDKYRINVEQKTAAGKFDFDIDSVTIRKYMDEKFKSFTISKKFGPRDTDTEEIIEELNGMGVETLIDLDNLFTTKFVSKLPIILKNYEWDMNYLGLIRNALLLKDTSSYFSNAWNNHWGSIDENSLKALEEHELSKQDIEIIKKYVSIH